MVSVTTVVANIAALRDTPASANGQVVYLAGYAADHDGGEGNFIWNGTTQIDDNDGTVIAPGVATGRWLRDRQRGPVNVLWFGADPTFSKDSTEQLQAAIDAAANAGGATVYLPPGRYKVSRPLVNKIGYRVGIQGA